MRGTFSNPNPHQNLTPYPNPNPNPSDSIITSSLQILTVKKSLKSGQYYMLRFKAYKKVCQFLGHPVF